MSTKVDQNSMKFRKKSVVVEAFQMTKERRRDNSEWPNWLHEAWQARGWPRSVGCEDYPKSDGTDRLVIFTLEGVMTVEWGDWIIRGVKGELYPCKPDIFEATYEPAGEPFVPPSIPLFDSDKISKLFKES